eukprot:TRINITY_DN656_c0_g1_i2.p1 TRINITY_DN656_c0_g1~~TRINITY_DN656_c0_g1_i2.p1  ORF type:complete len:326 (+),score=80.65 TRINITY_DN656_c0_g1_i2:37-1014(+)
MHYLHLECAHEIKAHAHCHGCQRCPMCRTHFCEVREIPNPFFKPMQWFNLVDRKRKGAARMDDVKALISATFSIPESAVEQLAQRSSRWAAAGAPDLYVEALPQFLQWAHAALRGRPGVPEELPGRDGGPSLLKAPQEWYKYYLERLGWKCQCPKDCPPRLLIWSVFAALMSSYGLEGCEGLLCVAWEVFRPTVEDDDDRPLATCRATDCFFMKSLWPRLAVIARTIDPPGTHGCSACRGDLVPLPACPHNLHCPACAAAPPPPPAAAEASATPPGSVDESPAPLPRSALSQPPLRPLPRRGAAIAATVAVVPKKKTLFQKWRGA